MIKKENKSEFIGQIMDIFEDFLDEYGIKVPQKKERKAVIRILRQICAEKLMITWQNSWRHFSPDGES